MYIAFAHMHVPQAYESKWFNSSTRKSHYGDALREVDDAVGRIVDAIDTHDKLQNTFVFITADNGPWNAKCTLTGSQGPFTGKWQQSTSPGRTGTGKFTTWEGGHREIGLAYWPGKVHPGVTDVLSSTMDLMPTVAAIAGAALPKDRTFDGLDMSPVLFNGAKQHHEFLFHPKGEGSLDAGRFGQYKVFWKTVGVAGCGEKLDLSLPFGSGAHDPPLVFDLSKDPAESTPITVSKALYAHFERVRNATMQNITNTFHSVPDYGQGTLKEQQPCCNVNNVVCRCEEAPVDAMFTI